MRRKITVYSLRFYETTFWNRLNTGFLEPAVATALTACGIETEYYLYLILCSELQRRLPLAVLKQVNGINLVNGLRGSCNGAYRLRY